MSTSITIIYTGPVVDSERRGMEIARYFAPESSYIDSSVYSLGYPNEDGVGDEGKYGKSIYATNVEGWGELYGLVPMQSTTTKFAQFQRAVFSAYAAKEAGTTDEGITFDVDDYQEIIYWTQMARNLADCFYTTVGDEEFGTPPAGSTGATGATGTT